MAASPDWAFWDSLGLGRWKVDLAPLASSSQFRKRGLRTPSPTGGNATHSLILQRFGPSWKGSQFDVKQCARSILSISVIGSRMVRVGSGGEVPSA